MAKLSVKSRPYEKNRKAAAQALYELAKCYEKVTYTTVYRQCYFDYRNHGAWRFIGKAHDYTY